MAQTPSPAAGPTVGLFATCLVDLMRPVVGFASVKLLEDAGCQVFVPKAQTCCGQPTFNSGDVPDTADIARGVIENFEEFDYVVVPSGSCGGMIKHHYTEVFVDDPAWLARAEALSAKTYELISFLTDIMNVTSVPASFDGSITYHDSCHLLHSLRIKDQPQQMNHRSWRVEFASFFVG